MMRRGCGAATASAHPLVDLLSATSGCVASTCVLGRLGRRDEAAAAYRKALELVGNDPERDFLRLRLAELADWRSALSRR
jgi:predicted RNA polymerase sigma factor